MLRIKLVRYEKIKSGQANILKDLKEGTIIIVDAKFTPSEETNLIHETMEFISDKFSGIELGSVSQYNLKGTLFGKFRDMLGELVMGKRMGITVIGPAKLVRRIESHPEDILLYL